MSTSQQQQQQQQPQPKFTIKYVDVTIELPNTTVLVCSTCKKPGVESCAKAYAYHVTNPSVGLSYIYHCCSKKCYDKGRDDVTERIKKGNYKFEDL